MYKDRRDTILDYIKKMPALPTSITKVMDVCNNPLSSPAELSKVISLDPVLMGRVMQLINSAYYGLSNKITSLVRAIIMLGLNTVKNLALSTAVLGTVGKSSSKAINMEDFWTHSLSVGVTAKIIAKKRGAPTGTLEEFFVGGLLHDIGKLPFINTLPKEYKKTISYAKDQSIPLLEAEDEQLAINHAEVGGLIATNWQLSEALHQAILDHHGSLTTSHRSLVYSVALANSFTNCKAIGFSGDSYPKPLAEEIFQYLGIGHKNIEEIEKEIEEAITDARVFLRLAMNK